MARLSSLWKTEQLGKSDDVFVSDMMLKLLGVLRPRLCPQGVKMPKWYGGYGLLVVPCVEGLVQRLEDVLLGWKDLVL